MVHLRALRCRLTLAKISSHIPNYTTQRKLAVEHAVYKHDGPGGLYVTGLPEFTIDEEIEVKVGHTRSLPRRCKQYQKCVHPTYCMVWSVYYPACLRMKAERLVHLAPRAKGAHPIIHTCLGVKCRKRHCEFYSLKAAGGWRAVEDEVVSALKATGQKDIKRCNTVLVQRLYRISHTGLFSLQRSQDCEAFQVKTQQWSSI
ncbi:hypothetical protein DFH09DRAFT_1088415 [Mycena vulgaris]|nr:hypothetical protein DFH09DRAFT_1088415 [Mycena vulgaris]